MLEQAATRRPPGLVTTAPARPGVALLAPLAIGAAALHVGAMLAAGSLTPDYRPWARAMSELGMGGRPYATLANVGGMIVPGALVLASAWLARRLGTTEPIPRAGLLAFALAGASLVLAGVVPFPAPAHLVAALGAGVACAVALAIVAPWASRQLASPAWKTTGIACALLLAVDAIVWIVAETSGAATHGAMGLEQRAASFSALAWWAACAWALARPQPDRAA